VTKDKNALPSMLRRIHELREVSLGADERGALHVVQYGPCCQPRKDHVFGAAFGERHGQSRPSSWGRPSLRDAKLML
jgi:hypothetical protein